MLCRVPAYSAPGLPRPTRRTSARPELRSAGASAPRPRRREQRLIASSASAAPAGVLAAALALVGSLALGRGLLALGALLGLDRLAVLAHQHRLLLQLGLGLLLDPRRAEGGDGDLLRIVDHELASRGWRHRGEG